MDSDLMWAFYCPEPTNVIIKLGDMHWHLHRDKPFRWWQVRMMEFCFGWEFERNAALLR